MLVLCLSISRIGGTRGASPENETTITGRIQGADGKRVRSGTLIVLSGNAARRCPDPFAGTESNVWTVATTFDVSQKSREDSQLRVSESGRFQVRVPEQPDIGVLVVATAEGFSPQLRILKPDTPATILLEEGRDLAIQIYENGGPALAAAEATLIPLSICNAALQETSGLFVRKARSDSDGLITFRNTLDGVYALHVVAEGHRSSTLSPLAVGPGRADFKIYLPRDRRLDGKFVAPAGMGPADGRIVAYWRNSENNLEWTSNSLIIGSGVPFEVGGLPFGEDVNLFAFTQAGTASRILSVSQVRGSDNPSRSFEIFPPRTWEARLEKGVNVREVFIVPMSPARPWSDAAPVVWKAQVNPNRQMVVPDVPSWVDELRFLVPGYGEAAVRLTDSRSSNLGLVKLRRVSVRQGRATWDGREPLQGAEIEIGFASGGICRAVVTREGEFACTFEALDVRAIYYRAWFDDAVLDLAPLPGSDPFVLRVAAQSAIGLTTSRSGEKGAALHLSMEIGSPERPAISRRTASRVFYLSPKNQRFEVHWPCDLRLFWMASVPGTGLRSPVHIQPMKDTCEATVRLPEPLSVLGRVVAKLSGRAIAGAEIGIGPYDASRERSFVHQVIRSDPSGRWQFVDVPEGRRQLIASSKGYIPKEKRILVPRDTAGADQILALQLPGSIHGRIIGCSKDASLSVTLRPDLAGADKGLGRFTIDSTQEFDLEEIAPGQHQLELEIGKARHATARRIQEVQVLEGQVTNVLFDLARGISLSGRVLLKGEPATRSSLVFLRVSPRTGFDSLDRASTDDSGHYEVDLPSPGAFHVFLQWDGAKRPMELESPLQIGSEDSQRRDLRFAPGRIRGRVVERGGVPVQGAEVWLYRAASDAEDGLGGEELFSRPDMVESGETGTFQFSAVPAGSYTLKAVSPGYAPGIEEGLLVTAESTLEVPEVVLAPESSLQVLAVNPAGSPLSGVTVNAYAGSSVAMSAAESGAITEESGQAIVRGLSKGPHVLTGLFPGLPPALVEGLTLPLQEQEQATVLRFAKGGALEIVVLDEKGSGIPGIEPAIYDDENRDVSDLYRTLCGFLDMPSMTDGDGRVRLEAVLPGEYEIKVQSGGLWQSEKINVREGQSTETALILRNHRDDSKKE